MTTFEPFVNLFVMLTILSVTAERVSNIFKFRNPKLRKRTTSSEGERKREGQIQTQTVFIGIVIAVLTKADMFAFLTHLDDPWSTLGWVRVVGSQWHQSPATQNLGAFLYSLGGSILTGFALGFGSKFWHDILSTVFEIRSIARIRGSEKLLNSKDIKSDDSASNGENDE
jgi:hypothetical protein